MEAMARRASLMCVCVVVVMRESENQVEWWEREGEERGGLIYGLVGRGTFWG